MLASSPLPQGSRAPGRSVVLSEFRLLPLKTLFRDNQQVDACNLAAKRSKDLVKSLLGYRHGSIGASVVVGWMIDL